MARNTGQVHNSGVGPQNREEDITSLLCAEIIDLESLDSNFVDTQRRIYPKTDPCIVDQNI